MHIYSRSFLEQNNGRKSLGGGERWIKHPPSKYAAGENPHQLELQRVEQKGKKGFGYRSVANFLRKFRTSLESFFLLSDDAHRDSILS